MAGMIFNLLGIFVFLFLFWKRLKEDYITNQIFSTASLILIGIILSNLIAKSFFPDWWFWLGFTGILSGLSLAIFRYGLRFFETSDAAVVSLLPWLGLIFLADSIANSSLTSLIGSLIILALSLLYFFFDTHYKKFFWYKSGRVGFSGFSIMGIFFLIRAAVAVAFPTVLSFSSNYESLLSGITAFISFLLVFNLAQQKT